MSKELELARELVKRLEGAERNEKVRLSELNPGDVFKIGEYDFIVLKHDCDTTTVISKDFMTENVVFDENTRDYNKSNLKKVIENEIQPIIESEVGSQNLVEHEVELTSVDMQHEFCNCSCKVRPITFDEAREYSDLLASKSLDDWWWTCTPWSTADRGVKHSIAVVSPSGSVFNYFCCSNIGVRPVCILKSNIFVSQGDK